MKLVSNPMHPDSFYGHHIGDIGIVRDLQYGASVEVEGRTSTSSRTPCVAYDEYQYVNITRQYRIDKLLATAKNEPDNG